MQNKLLAQGYEYYWNGAVQQCTETKAATYQAIILRSVQAPFLTRAQKQTWSLQSRNSAVTKFVF